MQLSGGCACGAVRYRISGEPVRISICHCTQCQKRTGSAFGMGCVFSREAVEVLTGDVTEYERIAESGNRVRFHFCSVCGTSVFWDFEAMPEARGIAAGTLDDTSWLDPRLHVWTKHSQGWFRFPDDADVLEQSSFGKPADS